MKIVNIILVLFVSAAQFVPAESQCTNEDVTLSNELQLQNGVIKLPAKVQDLTITMKQTKTCTITVTGYNDMKVNMTLVKYGLTDGGNECQNNYLKAGKTADLKDLTVCKADTKVNPVISDTSSLYLEIKSSDGKGTLQFKFFSVQGDECGSSIIILKQQNETVNFPMKSKPFTEKSDCDVTVKGIQDRAFTMYITDINLSNDKCDKDYLAASETQITGDPQTKMCKQADVKGPIQASKGELHLKIMTQSALPNAKVALQFQTIYSECGASEVEIPEGGLNITLPPTGTTFKTDTVCDIKFSSKDGKNFKMKIPRIKFPNGDCKDDYVSASVTKTNLPDDKYKKCGEAPVTDPLDSANGALYVQLKTKTPMADTMVQLQFESGSTVVTSGKYIFVYVILFKILNVMHG